MRTAAGDNAQTFRGCLCNHAGMPLFGAHQDAAYAPDSSDQRSGLRSMSGPEPQGLASLLSMLHSKHQGAALGPHPAVPHNLGSVGMHLSPLSVKDTMSGFSAAAAEIEVAKAEMASQQGAMEEQARWHGGVISHAVSPGSTNYQPLSPQL